MNALSALLADLNADHRKLDLSACHLAREPFKAQVGKEVCDDFLERDDGPGVVLHQQEEGCIHRGVSGSLALESREALRDGEQGLRMLGRAMARVAGHFRRRAIA